jgi:hypothetical protein
MKCTKASKSSQFDPFISGQESQGIRPVRSANHLAIKVFQHIRDYLKNRRIIVYNKCNWVILETDKEHTCMRTHAI